MSSVFEIIEKNEVNWVEIMMCEQKEPVCDGITAYLINKEPVMEYVVCNEKFDRCILIRHDAHFHVENFIEFFDMQYFLQSPPYVKGIITYNLSKMTSKCGKFRLRCWFRRIIDFIFDIVDVLLSCFGESEISALIVLVLSIIGIVLALKILSLGGI